MNQRLLTSVGAVAIVTALAGPVAAADLHVKAVPRVAPAPVALNWSGLYIGSHVGYGRATFTGGTFNTEEGSREIPLGDYHTKGLVVGTQAGYNWQLGPALWGSSWLVGIEGDATITPGWQENRCIGKAGSFCDNRSITGQLDWLASIRGRLGLAFDRTLIYATGGVAWAKNRQTACSDQTTCGFIKEVKTGGVVGGGIEWKYNPALSLRFEGLHYIFNESRTVLVDGCCEFATLGLRNVTVFRVGANWMFGPGDILPWGLGKGKSPVVARY